MLDYKHESSYLNASFLYQRKTRQEECYWQQLGYACQMKDSKLISIPLAVTLVFKMQLTTKCELRRKIKPFSTGDHGAVSHRDKRHEHMFFVLIRTIKCDRSLSPKDAKDEDTVEWLWTHSLELDYPRQKPRPFSYTLPPSKTVV